MAEEKKTITLPINKVVHYAEKVTLVEVDYTRAKGENPEAVEIWVEPEELNEETNEVTMEGKLFGRKAQRYIQDNSFVAMPEADDVKGDGTLFKLSLDYTEIKGRTLLFLWLPTSKIVNGMVKNKDLKAAFKEAVTNEKNSHISDLKKCGKFGIKNKAFKAAKKADEVASSNSTVNYSIVLTEDGKVYVNESFEKVEAAEEAEMAQ